MEGLEELVDYSSNPLDQMQAFVYSNRTVLEMSLRDSRRFLGSGRVRPSSEYFQIPSIGIGQLMERHGPEIPPQILKGLDINLVSLTGGPMSYGHVMEPSLTGIVPLTTGGGPIFFMETQSFLGSSEPPPSFFYSKEFS